MIQMRIEMVCLCLWLKESESDTRCKCIALRISKQLFFGLFFFALDFKRRK